MERFNSRTEEEKKERGSNLCGSIITLAINIAEVVVGYMYLDDEDCKDACLCKLDAARYLFYSGILGLSVSALSLFFTFCLGFMAICAACDGHISSAEKCALGTGCCLHWLVQLAVFVTQIVIVIWGFAVIFPAYSTWDYKDDTSLTYCHYTPFMFAFVLLIIQAVFFALAAPCIICLCCCAGTGAAFAAIGLSNRNEV